jgi:hypothetical protein
MGRTVPENRLDGLRDIREENGHCRGYQERSGMFIVIRANKNREEIENLGRVGSKEKF